MKHSASLARVGAGELHDTVTERVHESISYQAATCLQQVEDAWKLVYQRYLTSGFIAPNPYGIFTNPRAVHTDSCVVFGRCRNTGHLTSTMTLISDRPEGLSLDEVYRREMKQLRKQGRLLEVGLLVAECRATVSRDITALFELMKWGVHYALHYDMSNIVIGVHPRHVKFYTRWFAFEQFGPERMYSAVRNKPVVPLRLNLDRLGDTGLPRGLRHAADFPLRSDVFSGRYLFRPHELLGSLIERFVLSTQRAADRQRLHRHQEVPELDAALMPQLA